ncbi:hypothetical protein [Candidatus Protofrankia californiensis]|uniref:hypothetical protein n=1 Tax=Candidatus Protofrankia californiensis TaxID=1839754 RepID=UPI0019D2803B|nr:hypothetical protein [Candidatus Protofrankia californiensis]
MFRLPSKIPVWNVLGPQAGIPGLSTILLAVALPNQEGVRPVTPLTGSGHVRVAVAVT